MKTWSFFDSEGTILDRTFSGSEESLAANTPAGHTAIEGRYSPFAQRIDVATLAVVDWSEGKAARAAQEQAEAAQAVIEEIERKSARAVREALLVVLPEGQEKDRLAAIDSAIADERAKLSDTPLEPSKE